MIIIYILLAFPLFFITLAILTLFRLSADKKLTPGITNTLEVSITHLGGYPDFKEKQGLVFQLRSDGIFRIRIIKGCTGAYEYKIIDPKDIIKCECKTQQQISSEVTAGKILAFGIFALASKKQTKTINSYMIFDYKLNGVPVNCLFDTKEGQKLSQLVYKINESIIKNNEIAVAK